MDKQSLSCLLCLWENIIGINNDMQYRRKTLENGVRLITISGLPTNAVTISAFIKAGYRFDPYDKPGLAHFTEHMVFNGTANFPTVKGEARAIESTGGWHKAFTWIEHQKHTIHLPKSYFEVGVELLMETLSVPLLKKTEIEKEKGVIREEIFKNKSDLSRSIWDYVWHPLVFQNTHLARPYTGTGKDLDNISEKDIKNFLRDYFGPDNCVIFVASNLDEQYIQNIVAKNTKLFKNLAASRNLVRSITPKVKKNIFVHKDPSYYQTSLCIGVQTVPYNSPEKLSLNIIRDMLGGYFGTNLVQTLRNKGGLTYGWRCYREYIKETGYIMFNVSTAHKNVKKVTSIILNEFSRFASNRISDKEIELAKKHLIGSIYTNLETGQDYIDWYGLDELLNPKNVLSIEEKISQYEKTSNEEIRRVASKYFSMDKVLIGAIGNIDELTLKDFLA